MRMCAPQLTHGLMVRGGSEQGDEDVRSRQAREREGG